MFINRDPEAAYWFHAEQIRIIEEKYQAQYMGAWCVKNHLGAWTGEPVEVFYQPDYDASLGHGPYFGVFIENNTVHLTNAESAFSVPMTGVLLDTGEVLVSRYRHDYQVREGVWIDGGRDYVRCPTNAELVQITVQQDRFIFDTQVECLS